MAVHDGRTMPGRHAKPVPARVQPVVHAAGAPASPEPAPTPSVSSTPPAAAAPAPAPAVPVEVMPPAQEAEVKAAVAKPAPQVAVRQGAGLKRPSAAPKQTNAQIVKPASTTPAGVRVSRASAPAVPFPVSAYGNVRRAKAIQDSQRHTVSPGATKPPIIVSRAPAKPALAPATSSASQPAVGADQPKSDHA